MINVPTIDAIDGTTIMIKIRKLFGVVKTLSEETKKEFATFNTDELKKAIDQLKLEVGGKAEQTALNNLVTIVNGKAATAEINRIDTNIVNVNNRIGVEEPKIAASINNVNRVQDGSTVVDTFVKNDGSSLVKAMPVASSNQAGVMNPATFKSIQDNIDRITVLETGSVQLNVTFPNTDPTQNQIEVTYESAYPTKPVPALTGTTLVDFPKTLGYRWDGTKWQRFNLSTSQQPFTNTTAGVIKGDSATVGKVFAEVDGTGSVNGWDGLIAKIEKNLNDITTINATTIPNINNRITLINESKQDENLLGSGAPTTTTIGKVNQIYVDTTNRNIYICSYINNNGAGAISYVWVQLPNLDGYLKNTGWGSTNAGNVLTVDSSGNIISKKIDNGDLAVSSPMGINVEFSTNPNSGGSTDGSTYTITSGFKRGLNFSVGFNAGTKTAVRVDVYLIKIFYLPIEYANKNISFTGFGVTSNLLACQFSWSGLVPADGILKKEFLGGGVNFITSIYVN